MEILVTNLNSFLFIVGNTPPHIKDHLEFPYIDGKNEALKLAHNKKHDQIRAHFTLNFCESWVSH